MKASPLLVDDGDGVRLLTLNRPEQRNAMTIELYRALTAALREADGDEDVGAIVLTGAGTVFCAGTDLGELAAIAAGNAPDGAGRAFPDLMASIIDLEVPLVAAVNGAGVGLGFTVLALCDLVVMADSARLRAPFAELGVPPEAASSYLLPVRMGWQRAAASLLTGDWLSAPEALSAGIATTLCPADEVLPRAMAEARRIAQAPAAARAVKRLMRDGQRDAVMAARRREDGAYAELFRAKG